MNIHMSYKKKLGECRNYQARGESIIHKMAELC